MFAMDLDVQLWLMKTETIQTLRQMHGRPRGKKVRLLDFLAQVKGKCSEVLQDDDQIA